MVPFLNLALLSQSKDEPKETLFEQIDASRITLRLDTLDKTSRSPLEKSHRPIKHAEIIKSNLKKQFKEDMNTVP